MGGLGLEETWEIDTTIESFDVVDLPDDLNN